MFTVLTNNRIFLGNKMIVLIYTSVCCLLQFLLLRACALDDVPLPGVLLPICLLNSYPGVRITPL